MRFLTKFFSLSPVPRQNSNVLQRLFESHHSHHLSIRAKSSKRHPPRKASHSKNNARLKKSKPISLYQKITDIIGPERPTTTNASPHDHVSDESCVRNDSIPAVCQIARESGDIVDAEVTMLEKSSVKDTYMENLDLEEVSRIVHRITAVVRANDSGICMEKRLGELGLMFSSDVVEKVLKRCFKVGQLAYRFFNWLKTCPGFSHTTETYNTMIYVAGEAREFDLVEKLVGEMDQVLCPKDIKTWTILISHYGKAKQIGKALSTFQSMRKSGCLPDKGVYEAILRALCNAGKAELAMEFYKEMVSRSIVLNENIYVMLTRCFANSESVAEVRMVGDDMMKMVQIPESKVYTYMLRCFCMSGKIHAAKELFEEMKSKNMCLSIEVSEILVKGLCRACRVEDAIEIVVEMKNKSVVGNKVYGSLIDGFLRKGAISRALELLEDMKRFGCQLMVSSYTQLIQHLFRSDEYKKACDLYDEMLENDMKPDIVAMTAMIAGHVQHGNFSQAWKIFEGANESGMKPTWKVYSVFIKELCKASKSGEAVELLKRMLDSNIDPTEDLCRLVISYLTREGELERARQVVQICNSSRLSSSESKGMMLQTSDRRSVHREHEALSCSLNQDSSSAIETSEHFAGSDLEKEYNDDDLEKVCEILSSSSEWDSMQIALESSEVHFTPRLVEAILRYCQIHGRAALQFFCWIGKLPGYRHTGDTYNMAIKISGGAKDFKHMRDLYLEMRRSGCSITPNTWTIMIAQYGQAGLTEIALRTFKEMKGAGYRPDGSTYKYLIVFLCGKKGRKVDKAINIFQEMIHYGYMPDKEMVQIYLSSLCESGKLEDARTAVKSLCKRGFSPQLGFSLLINSLCRAARVEEALILADEMKHLGFSLNPYNYGSIVHALLRGGRLDEALDKVDAMKRAGISETTHIHTSLIVHFCKEKKIGKAIEVFKKMGEDGCKPSVVTFSALIRGYMNMGMISNAWDIFHRMKVKGPFPDFETYSMFMNCLCKVGRSEDGLQLIHEMLEIGIIPSTINFRTVYYGLNREGKHDLAHSVLQTKWLLNRKRKFYT